MEPEFVFVYGGLMRGFDLHHYMERASFVGEGSTAGVLFSLGQYPGLMDGAGTARGEVYRFDDLPAALDILDDVEDYNPTDPENSLYVRVVRQVRMDDGRTLDAWVYVYNRRVADQAPVPGGNWRNAGP